MQTTQLTFYIFLALVLGFTLITSNNTIRKSILLAASYYFYACWDARLLPLLLIPTIVDYSIGKYLGRIQTTRHRELLLSASIVLNIGMLAFFKYYNFFIESFASLLTPLGVNMQTMEILLPIGISFFTFSTLTYVIDVYRKEIEPCHSLLNYALFIAFFPKLVAGPIARASYLLPQFKTLPCIDRHRLQKGFSLIVCGLFMKVFIADRLGLYVDPVFESVSSYSGITLWFAAIAYSLQIYFDFAGYSQVAIGAAAILGVELEKNFDFPYLSTNISEFWRRWHISLSDWIRDYIYISLGGNRKGQVRTYINIILAMTLCGLWHGAAWTFVFWGAYHGVVMAINNAWRKFHFEPTSDALSFKLINWVLTMMVVMIGWIFFRAANFQDATEFILGMMTFNAGFLWIHPFLFFVLLSTVCVHVFHKMKWRCVHMLPADAWYTPFVLFSLLWLVVLFKTDGFAPFIYAQF